MVFTLRVLLSKKKSLIKIRNGVHAKNEIRDWNSSTGLLIRFFKYVKCMEEVGNWNRNVHPWLPYECLLCYNTTLILFHWIIDGHELPKYSGSISGGQQPSSSTPMTAGMCNIYIYIIVIRTCKCYKRLYIPWCC